MDDNKTKRPTLKQSKFIDAYVENGGNATQAAMVAYNVDNKHDAANIGAQNLAKPHVLDIITSKVKELKDNTLDTLKKNNLMGLALDTAHDDLQDPDPRVRAEARKFVLKVAEFLSETERKPNGSQHNHLHVPKWRG